MDNTLNRTMRSLPKDISDHSKNAWDRPRVDEADHDASILKLASDVLWKYGFGSHASSVEKISWHVRQQTIGPVAIPAPYERNYARLREEYREGLKAEEERA